MFSKYVLDTPNNLFKELSESIKFEDITKGRKGAVLTHVSNKIPIVRTTTKYSLPSYNFLDIHLDIVDKIKKAVNIPNLELNNALIEIYNDDYKTMGFHSDQALDLDPDSYICIFSVYENPIHDNRLLIINEKESVNECKLKIDHNSVIVFSVSDNSKHVHKIILESKKSTKWLGITFRFSKTHIVFKDEIPYFYRTDKQLTLLKNENEVKEFYKLRSDENKFKFFSYPCIYYTISESDILPPIE